MKPNSSSTLRVLHVAAECAPLVKVGGLGDVVGALPKVLFSQGVDVAVGLPFYASIDKDKLSFKSETETISVDFAKETQEVVVSEAVLPASKVPVFLFQNKKYLDYGPYDSASAIGGGEHEDIRFSFFSAAVAVWLKDHKFDVVHCHDKHLSLLCKEVKFKNLSVKTVLTIHNLANMGSEETGLAVGIEYADMVTTVSPQYAKEIQTAEFGYGLETELTKKASEGKLVGILNGLDEDYWNPKTDERISSKLVNFDQVAGFKEANKKFIFEKLELDGEVTDPLFVFIGRLTGQKGSDLLIDAWRDFAREQKGRLVILGVGEATFVKDLEQLEKLENKEYGIKRVIFCEKFDEQLAHELYAGTDFFLVPSRFEPCGLTQMIAMRYGAIPIVRDVGGLHDTVKDEDSGLVFENADSVELLAAIGRAAGLFQTEEFETFRRRIVELDWSWEKSATKFKEIYSKLLR